MTTDGEQWQWRTSTEVQTNDGQTVMIDGPTLRSARQSQNVSIRRLATVAGVSHSHLSKVENGELGRPVTPAILNAYEKALRIKIADAVAAGELAPDQNLRPGRKYWHPGQMTDHQRLAWRSQVAAVAAGGSAGMPDVRLLHSAGHVAAPTPLADDQVVSVEQVADLLDGLDGLAGAVAHHLLAWTIRLEPEPRVAAVTARLARRAAAAVLAEHRHESARSLLLLALSAAAKADHPDLQALILADIADQQVTLGYPDDALVALRQAAGDDRISEEARGQLKAIRARAEAAGS